MGSLYLFIAFVCFGSSFAFSGEYIPKSFYTIDENGHKSDVIYIRKSFLPRTRRSAPGGSYGGGFAFEGAAAGPEHIAGAVQAGLDDTFQKLRSLAGQAQAHGAVGGGGGTSYSGSFSSSGGGGGEGPVLHARFADGERELVTGGVGHIKASSSASGPNGAISFSSSSVGDDGQVRYNTYARKF